MYVIRLCGDKTLMTTGYVPVFQGEQNADTLVLLLPKIWGLHDVGLCTVLMQVVLPDGTQFSSELAAEGEPYNADWLQYRVPLSSAWTALAGTVALRLNITDETGEMLLRTDKAEISIQRVGTAKQDPDENPDEEPDDSTIYF